MKYDVSNKISETVADYGVSYRQIARAAGVSPSTISCASKAGYMVTKPVRDAIDYGCNKLSMHTTTATLAANLKKQVDALRDTVAFNFANVQVPVNKVDGLHPSCTTLVDDQIESARGRERAELQKALAARIDELKAERNKGLSTLAQLSRAEDLLKTERLKNETQYQSIGQCFAEIKRLQDELNHQKLITASRNADLAVYQKALEDADARVDDAEYKAAELKRDLTVQRAWTWFFLVLSFVAAVVRVVK